MELQRTMSPKNQNKKKFYHCLKCKMQGTKAAVTKHFLNNHNKEGLSCPNPKNCIRRQRPDILNVAKKCNDEVRIFTKEELSDHKELKWLPCKRGEDHKETHFRPCEVTKCNKSYANRGVRKFGCHLCPKSLSSNQMLKIHLKKIHKQKDEMTLNDTDSGEETDEDMVRVHF